jgi:hypothetical protein
MSKVLTADDLLQRHSVQREIPALGPVTLQTVTMGEIRDAERASRTSEEETRTEDHDLFANVILARMITDPTLSMEEIQTLSRDTLSALLAEAADVMGMRSEFEESTSDFEGREVLYQAHRKRMAAVTASPQQLASSVDIGVRALGSIGQELLGFLRNATKSLEQPVLFRFEPPTIDFRPLLGNFEDGVERLFESFKKLNPVLAKASAIMASNGWWIVGSLPISFYGKLIEIEDQVDSSEITDYITAFANENDCKQLVDIVDSWEVDVFQHRKEIFEQALWAHIRKKFALTVPALIVQVEGVIREFMATYGDGFVAWRLESVIGQLKQKFSQLEVAPQEQEIGFEEVESLINYHNLNTLEKLYDAYDPRSHDDPSDVNRNAISHGLWLSYSTSEFSTKLFLLLDMLHSMFHQLKKRSSE